MENVRKHRNIKLVTTKARRIYLVSEPNNYTKISFSESYLELEIKEHKYLRINLSISVYQYYKSVK